VPGYYSKKNKRMIKREIEENLSQGKGFGWWLIIYLTFAFESSNLKKLTN